MNPDVQAAAAREAAAAPPVTPATKVRLVTVLRGARRPVRAAS